MAEIVVSLGAAAFVTGCGGPKPYREIDMVLQRQASNWNKGDIEAFMDDYVHSDELTFSAGGETQRGWQNTLDRYKKRYPDVAAMGKLRFWDIDTNALGRENAFTLGKWQLTRESGDIGGNFTLIWRRDKDGRWRILHDHTSMNAAK